MKKFSYTSSIIGRLFASLNPVKAFLVKGGSSKDLLLIEEHLIIFIFE